MMPGVSIVGHPPIGWMIEGRVRLVDTSWWFDREAGPAYRDTAVLGGSCRRACTPSRGPILASHGVGAVGRTRRPPIPAVT